MKFGCHVSIRKGYLGAAKQAAALNAAAYQFFPKNPRSLTIKNYDPTEAKLCKEYCCEHQLTSVAHTPYPTSLTPSSEKREITISSLLNDLEIANACGSEGVVVHFGKKVHRNDPLADYQLMISMLNSVLSQWKGDCKILLENNAGKPGSIGTTFEELVQVRKLCDYPEKIGFCLDTCHAFASGLWTGDNWLEVLENGQKLGYFEHLKVIHLNNSMYKIREGKDRHTNIFNNGYIRENQFEELVLSPVLIDIPFILETPSKSGITHEEEIQQLNLKWGSH
ncbi:deoxyribonuclease IV [Metabacillus sp. RGM 3146]|uniref:deoxyribonuclease IV n=1 Tax=Metabacillus sp. RGM 3146 TaxID=3401092 RepID=UPI003B9A7294